MKTYFYDVFKILKLIIFPLGIDFRGMLYSYREL